MTSAFGVAHAVAKSQLPGGAYRAVARLLPKERDALRQGLSTPGPRGSVHLRGNSTATSENRALHALRRAPTEASAHPKVRFAASLPQGQRDDILRALPAKIRRPVAFHDPRWTAGGTRGGEGATVARTSTREPARIVVTPKASAETVSHEFAHSQARRNYHRLGVVSDDAGKSGREEGRADALAVRAHPQAKVDSGYEINAIHHAAGKRGNKVGRGLARVSGTSTEQTEAYTGMRAKLGQPIRGADQLSGRAERAALKAGEPGGASIRTKLRRKVIGKSAFGVVHKTALLSAVDHAHHIDALHAAVDDPWGGPGKVAAAVTGAHHAGVPHEVIAQHAGLPLSRVKAIVGAR